MKDFDILFKEGRFVNGSLISAKIWKINTEKYPERKYSNKDLKIGFVVSKKVSKKAFVRNRLKRQMREIVRLYLKENGLREGFMALFMAKEEMIGKEYEEIRKSMIDVLKKGGILSS